MEEHAYLVGNHLHITVCVASDANRDKLGPKHTLLSLRWEINIRFLVLYWITYMLARIGVEVLIVTGSDNLLYIILTNMLSKSEK